MSYNIQTRDGIILRNIPDNMAEDAPELKALVTEERKKRNDASRPARMAADLAADTEKYDPTKDMSWGQKALANVGAGMNALGQGAKQLMGAGAGDDAEAERRALDANLAAKTTGGGALQLAGELAPTLALPGGLVAKGISKALPLAARGLTAAIGEGAVLGAGTGALTPTMGDESRLGNMAMGAAGGAAATGVIGAAARSLPLATAAGREQSALRRQGGALKAALGDEADVGKIAGAVENYNPRGVTSDIPLTTAQMVRRMEGANAGGESSALARVELGARKHAPSEFAELGRRQNEALFKATERAGAEGGLVDTFAQARSAATDPLRERALQSAGRWPEVGKPLEADVASLMRRSVPGDPARGLAQKAQQMLGENPSPQQLYQFRKVLANKLSGPMIPGDEMAAIAKGAERETKALMAAIDARLNEAGSSKALGQRPWSEYMDEYIARSKPVTSARAQSRISEGLATEGGALVGNAPEVTRNKLSQLLRKHGSNTFGDTLTPAARGRYDELMQTMQHMEEPMRSVKLGGTGGGGSQTAMQTALPGAASMMTGHPLVGAALRSGQHAMTSRAGEDIAALMLDPQRAAKAIRAKMAQSLPLTSAEEQFLRLTSGAGAGAAGALTQQQ